MIVGFVAGLRKRSAGRGRRHCDPPFHLHLVCLKLSTSSRSLLFSFFVFHPFPFLDLLDHFALFGQPGLSRDLAPVRGPMDGISLVLS